MGKHYNNNQITVDLSNISLDGSDIDNTVYSKEEVNNTTTLDMVIGIINNGENVIDKLKNIMDDGLSKLAISLYEYELDMNSSASNSLNDNELGSKHYSLYARLFKVINAKDYETFEPYFDLINFMFNKYKDSSYSEYALNRADLYFPGDRKQLRTYQHLVTLLCILCNPPTRNIDKKKISTASVFDLSITSFNDTSINNIKRYYDI